MTNPNEAVLSPAVDAAVSSALAGTNGQNSKKKPPTIGPVRQQLEAFGVAILAAVLLKWFCLEAFQIPTSSMQPTLMGSSEAGVYDRILVNKLIPLLREPKRWDITVFKYPLQKNQNYVKRIAGMPNDRLLIAGGNLWQVIDEGGNRSYRIERKPDDLQEAMWKNVHPARMQARSETKMLGAILGHSPLRGFEERDGIVTVAVDGSMVLTFRDEADGGMIDRVWDGYPEAVMRAMREQLPMHQPQEIVPDVRITAAVTAEQAVDELVFEVLVARPKFAPIAYQLVAKGGKGQLVVKVNGKQVGASPEFAMPITPGTASEIAFAHVDARLVAWQDGAELQSFECAAEWECRDDCVLPFTMPPEGTNQPGKLELPPSQKVTPQITAKGKGKIHFAELRIDRDQHYTRSGAQEVIEVPDGHYYMLGDNTLQSIDARGWTAIIIGVDADDNIVHPDTQGARRVRGNKRAMNLDRAPDRDETPIPIPSEHAVIMIDEYGEIMRLKGDVGPDWGKRVTFQKRGAADGRGDWEAPEATNAKGISFVPRSDIQGRATLIFYPSRPFSWLTFNSWPGRFGFVR